MNTEIAEFIKKCETCQKFKSYPNKKIPIQNLSLTNEPFEQLFMDLTVYPDFNGYRYLLTMQDDLHDSFL